MKTQRLSSLYGKTKQTYLFVLGWVKEHSSTEIVEFCCLADLTVNRNKRADFQDYDYVVIHSIISNII